MANDTTGTPPADPPTKLGYELRVRRKTDRWVATLVIIGIIALIISILLPSISHYRVLNSSSTHPCVRNLSRIGMGIQLFVNKNQKRYPSSLSALASTEQLSTEIFRCVDSKRPAPTTQSYSYPDTDGDYTYLGAGLVETRDLSQNIIVAYEHLSNHGEGMYILFSDGRVEWLESKNLDQVFLESNQLRQQWEVKHSPATVPTSMP